MKSLGFYMLIFGAGSAILSFMGMNFRLLMWIDLWGPTIGWLIRGGLIGLGLLLMILGPAEAEEEVQETQEAQEVQA
jgi:hypothetical protein